MVALDGRAGTGKTLLAVAAGLEQVVEQGRYERLAVYRPLVPVGRADVGFLPGGLDEKLDPWMAAIHDAVVALTDQGSNKDARHLIDELTARGQLSLESVTFLRGRSLHRQMVVVDEAQNLEPTTLRTILTRVGEGTKVVFTGDTSQIDAPYLGESNNALAVLIAAFAGQPLLRPRHAHGLRAQRRRQPRRRAAVASRPAAPPRDASGHDADGPDAGRVPRPRHPDERPRAQPLHRRRGGRSAPRVPRPRAILVVSAHWYINATAVTAMARPRTIHDFYGFPDELFAVEYPAPGDPELAAEVADVVKPDVGRPRPRQLGHRPRHLVGARARVPRRRRPGRAAVDQRHQAVRGPPRARRRARAAARPRRAVVGSGNVVHNLRRDRLVAARRRVRLGAALRRRRAPSYDERPGRRRRARRAPATSPPAVPTPDHFIPLLYLAGLAAAAASRRDVLVDGYAWARSRWPPHARRRGSARGARAPPAARRAGTGPS